MTVIDGTGMYTGLGVKMMFVLAKKRANYIPSPTYHAYIVRRTSRIKALEHKKVQSLNKRIILNTERNRTMNRKQQIKWRFRRFRLRSAVFMRRNGLYLALAGCLASLGGAAVLIFTAGGNDAPNAPVNRSDDQRLENVLNTVSAESGTPVPAVVHSRNPE